MEILSTFIVPIAAFLLTLAFGFWLSHVGRPYNGVLFNIHKLLALGAVIVAGWQVARLLGGANSPGLILLLLAVAALAAVALFATGALMSQDKADYALTLTIHRIAPAVLAVAAALAAYLLAQAG